MAPPPAPRPPSIDLLRRRLRESRRAQEWDLAEQACDRLLDLLPDDRRAWAARAWLARARGDLDGAAAALAALAQRAEARGFLRDRNRLTLRRAILEDQGEGPPAAALEAALQQAAASDDARGLLLVRQRIVEAAVRSGEPAAASAAMTDYLAVAATVEAEDQALQLVSGIASGAGPVACAAARLLAARAAANHEPEIAVSWLREVTRRDPGDAADAEALEAVCLTHARWTDLADLYRRDAAMAAGPQQTRALARLAELLEDELGRAEEAAEAYAAAGAAGLGVAAWREALRIHEERGDPAAVERMLDEAAVAARPGVARAEVRVLSARWRRKQKNLQAAADDLDRALLDAPNLLSALCDRAEIAAVVGDANLARDLRTKAAALGAPPPGLARSGATVHGTDSRVPRRADAPGDPQE